MQRIVKPEYVDPLVFGGGEPLQFRPPMLFREVSARVFPLKANIARLAEFVDEYLNMDIPDEIVHFEPALPYVYFMALNYGGMSATTLDAQRLGWVAQHEAFFLVPLQRWRREHGKLVFKGWTGVTPFIFVDDALSMTTGREVYGWPKMLASIEPDRPVWTTHPRAPTRLFTMNAHVFPDVYAGKREPKRTLVAIDRDTPASYAEYPLNYRCPWTPTSVVHNLYATSASLLEEAAEFAAHLRLRGFPDVRTSDSLMEMAREAVALGGKALAGLSPIPLPWPEPVSGTGERAGLVEDLPRYFSSTVNLKQFRDPERPERACYSALVASAMGVDRLNQIGLLGDWDLLRGDKSGGYSLSIARYRAQPIIETLGIEVPNLYERAREGDVVTLRPSFPFWMDVDLYYGAGDVLCSRTPNLRGGEWLEEWQAEGASGRHRVGVPHGRTPRPGVHRDSYNTALGAATLPISGPMRFPDVALQVYPLLADREVLQRFVDWSWNRLFKHGEATPKLSLELAGTYVYLLVESVGDEHGRMWSASENIGWWAEREISFAIPVRWRLDGELVGLVFIEPLVFADKPRAVVTYREVNGRNAYQAKIESPPDAWTSHGGPAAPRRLVRVTTESFVELGFGLGTKSQPLIEIGARAPLPHSDLPGWRAIADNWGRAYADELQRKARAWRDEPGAIRATQALALESFARGAPLNRLTLKQYRDASEFDRACYQAVVQTQRRIERVHALEEIEQPLDIALHRRVNYPIVETLGLKVKYTSSGDSVVDHLEPVRPFYLRAALAEDLGRVVATADPLQAAGSQAAPARRWAFHKPAAAPEPAARGLAVAEPPSYFHGEAATRIGAGMVDSLRKGDRQDLPGRLQILARRKLAKELHALRGAALGLPEPARKEARAHWPDALAAAVFSADSPLARGFAAFLDAEPLEKLYEYADALRLRLPAWPVPGSTAKRGHQLARLAELALDAETLPDWLKPIFATPDCPADPALRGASAAEIETAYAALRRGEAAAVSFAGPQTAAPVSALIGLVKRVEQWIVAPPDWRESLPVAAEKAFRRLRIARFVAEYDFDAARIAGLEAAFDAGAGAALEALAAAPAPFPEMQRRHETGAPLDPTAALVLIADAFADDVKDWADPARFLRMTRPEARAAVQRLDDLQLVFEAILDDRWAGQGKPREAPHARIPAACVGPLGRDEATWAAPNGLRREGSDFVVPDEAS